MKSDFPLNNIILNTRTVDFSGVKADTGLLIHRRCSLRERKVPRSQQYPDRRLEVPGASFPVGLRSRDYYSTVYVDIRDRDRWGRSREYQDVETLSELEQR